MIRLSNGNDMKYTTVTVASDSISNIDLYFENH